MALGSEDASLLLPQGSRKLLVHVELKYFHPQVGVDVLKSCSCRELWVFPLQNYFLGQFSKINRFFEEVGCKAAMKICKPNNRITHT